MARATKTSIYSKREAPEYLDHIFDRACLGFPVVIVDQDRAIAVVSKAWLDRAERTLADLEQALADHKAAQGDA